MTEETKEESRGILGTIFGPMAAGVKAGFGGWAGVYAAGRLNGSDPGFFDYLKAGAVASIGSYFDNLFSGGKHGGFGEGLLVGASAEGASGKEHIGIFNSIASIFAGGTEARVIDEMEDRLLPNAINRFVPAF